MARFNSLVHAPLHTRSVLRRRLAQLLEKERYPGRFRAPDLVLHDDEVVLRLFQGLSSGKAEEPEFARAIFEVSRPDIDPYGRTLDDLVEEGWMCAGWNRIVVSLEVAAAASDAFPASSAFRNWLASRYWTEWKWIGPPPENDEALRLSELIGSGGAQPGEIAPSTPQWVSARLWDRRTSGPSEDTTRLLWWVQKWFDLGYPKVAFDDWAASEADAFQAAVVTVTVDAAEYRGWDDYRTAIVRQIARASRREPKETSGFVDKVPPTLAQRLVWLGSNRIEQSVMAIGAANHFSLALIRILCRAAEQQDFAPALAFGQVLSFSISHPEVLAAITGECHDHPRLLADLLLTPELSALACVIIAGWRATPDSWERELFEVEARRSKREAFIDAVSIAVHWFAMDRVPAAEIAGIYWWLHQAPGIGADRGITGDEELLDIFRGELTNLPTDKKEAIANELNSFVDSKTMESPSFIAALDFLDTFRISSVDPNVLTASYIATVAEGYVHPHISRVKPSAAASLCRLAKTAGCFERLLTPFDVRQRLEEAEARDDNGGMAIDELARSVRIHIRVLSRAVAGHEGRPDKEIVTALANYIRIGALAHREKGKVAAFAAYHESRNWWNSYDGSIAEDVASAVCRLDGEELESVVTRVLESDEPGFLAQLSSMLPSALQGRFARRIDALTPEEAARIGSISDLQMRIEHLLNGGFLTAAERFMAEERAAVTLGKTQGREAIRLQFDLQLALLRGNWDVIDGATLPTGLNHTQEGPVRDILCFYKALSQLRRPGGNAEQAVALLEHLHRTHPSVQSYSTNLFAGKLNRLMNDGPFCLLKDAKLQEGLTLLSEYESLVGSVTGGPNADSLLCNGAILLLAVGRPLDARALLSASLNERPTAQFAAYDAIALSRLGMREEAIERIAESVLVYGETELLVAVRSHIGDSAERSKGAARVVTTDGGFELVEPLNHVDFVVFNWDRSHAKTHSRLVSSVSAACGSLMALTAATLAKADLNEDGYSTVLREILGHQVERYGWSVPDQSLGGTTAAGNPGERDLVVRNGTVELTVVEAVICKGRAELQKNRRELVSHLRKLFGYGTCRIFFHLTYCFESVIVDTLDVLKGIAKESVFDGLLFDCLEEMPSLGSSPDGFVAHYLLDRTRVTVVFLALNLGQETQKLAAVEAVRGRKASRIAVGK